MWTPAFPGQRPPFQPGHELTLKHGARSPRKVNPLAAQYVAAVLADDDVAYLRAPAYLPAVQAWAAAEARVSLIEAWVADMTMERATESGQGQTSPLELLRKWEASAATHRARLGLDPLSRARLGRDQMAGAADMARIMAEMHRADQEDAGGTE